MLGTLSAIGTSQYSTVSGQPGGVFIPGLGTNIAIEARGDALLTGNLSANKIAFTGNVLNTFTNPVTALGEFLEVTVNGLIKYVRLWQYE
jgi:hypothetical protein